MNRKNVLRFWVSLAVLMFATQAGAAPKIGDKVWAQWLPNQWYPGKIDKAAPVGFHIAFDDGDQAERPASLIAVDASPKKEEATVGTRVLASRAGKFFPGAISQIDQGKYTVQFDDAKTETVELDGLRLLAVKQEEARTAKVGDTVWAQWRPNAWFHGKAAKKCPLGLHVEFDDGDKADLAVGLITVDKAPKAEEVKVGSRVIAVFSDGHPYPGIITQVADGKYSVQYDDGDKLTVELDKLRLLNE